MKPFKNKPTIGIKCTCGWYDYVTIDDLSSGLSRSCGKCIFNLTPEEKRQAIIDYKMKRKTSPRQQSIYD